MKESELDRVTTEQKKIMRPSSRGETDLYFASAPDKPNCNPISGCQIGQKIQDSVPKERCV